MKTGFVSVFALFASVAAFGADPYVGYIYPSGIQAGTTNTFIVGGQYLRKLRGIHFGGNSLRVVNVQPVPGFAPAPVKQRQHLVKWLDSIAKGVKEEPVKPEDVRLDEWRSNLWWQALGTLGPLEISIVERNLFVPRNPLQDAPSLRQMNVVTLAAGADAQSGTFDLSFWNDAGISAPRPFTVSALDRVAEPLYSPPHRANPEPAAVDLSRTSAVVDGQIMPGETDVFKVRLLKGRRYPVKVAARELQPYVGDAVPGFFNPVVKIKDPSGTTVAEVDDTARFRPDPEFDFTPSCSGVYTVEIHDVLYRGRADFVYSIQIGSDEDARELNLSGRISGPGEKSVCAFTVNRPGRRVFELSARKDGSALDAVLTIRKAGCEEALVRWDDTTNRFFIGTVAQSECDPAGEYDFKDPGEYIAQISDRTGHGGDDYYWKLNIRRPRPDFEVYSTRSTLPFTGSKPLNVDFVIVRKDGFDGKVELGFPDCIAVKGAVATSGVERVTATLSYTGAKPLGVREVKLYAYSQISGRTVCREIVPCNEYGQAFAGRHLVPAESFVMRAIPAKKEGSPRRKGNVRK
jgi:hypothetical protein